MLIGSTSAEPSGAWADDSNEWHSYYMRRAAYEKAEQNRTDLNEFVDKAIESLED